jgi:hypothetical protein
MFDRVMCDSGHSLRSQSIWACRCSSRVCLDDFSQTESRTDSCYVLAGTHDKLQLSDTYFRHIASKLPASVKHPLPYCNIDNTNSAWMASRQGELSAASIVDSFKWILRTLKSSRTISKRLLDSIVAAVIAWSTNGRPVSDRLVNPSRHLVNVC